MSASIAWNDDIQRPSRPVPLFKAGGLTGSTIRILCSVLSRRRLTSRFLVARVTKRVQGAIRIVVDWPALVEPRP